MRACVRLISDGWPLPDLAASASLLRCSSALWRSLALLDPTVVYSKSWKLSHTCVVRIPTWVCDMRKSSCLWDLDSVFIPLKIPHVWGALAVPGQAGKRWSTAALARLPVGVALVHLSIGSKTRPAGRILLFTKSAFGTRREDVKYRFNCAALSSVMTLIQTFQELCCVHIFHL